MARTSPSTQPPHCPNPACRFHLDSRGWRYKRAGFHPRLKPPLRVQRYRCSHCERAFSSQTFSTTYWLKRPELQQPILLAEVNGAGHRQIARQHGTVHSTVQRHVARLGRHLLLRHEQMRQAIRQRTGDEPLIIDGLRTFAGGQYWVLEITHLIGARSYFSYDFVVTERRRSGTMTDAQKKRCARHEQRLGRPDPQGLRRDSLELLEASLPPDRVIELRSDEEKAYPWAIRRLRGRRIRHETTPSTAPRTPHNPLFAINAHHAFARHSAKSLARETIAFSKKIASLIWRQALFQGYVNETKWASERVPTSTPAMRLGVRARRTPAGGGLGQRLFPSRMALRDRLKAYYAGTLSSRFLERERPHALKYAF